MKTDLRGIILRTLLMATFSFSMNMLSPVRPSYFKQFGLTDVQLSLIFSLFPLTIILFSPAIGRISDHIGRKRIILFGVVAEAAALSLYLFDSVIWAYVAARILEALAFVSVSLVSLASIQDCIHNPTRSKYSGMSFSIDQIGVMSGSLIGGYLADSFGITAPFYASMAIMIMLSIMLSTKKNNEKFSMCRHDFDIFQKWKDFLSVRKLRGMAILGFFTHAKGEAISVFFPLFIIQTLGGTFKEVGIGLFLFSSFLVFQFAVGSYVNGRRKEGIIIGGVILTALSTIMFAQATEIYTVYLFVFITSIGSAFWNVSAWSMMSDIGEKKKMEGELVGSYVSIAKIGAFFSLLINGFIVALWGFRTLFIMHSVLVLFAAAAASFFFCRRNGRRQTSTI